MLDSKQIPNENTHDFPWSGTIRALVSLVLVLYLGVVLLGPLANPVGSDHLTTPLAQTVRPIHQAAFLGHGYRFFGPDPGPGHVVDYEIVTDSGTQIHGRFPDRNQHWPRLMYHRWFMLSETIFDEHEFTPSRESYEAQLKQIDQEISNLNSGIGSRPAVETLQKQKQEFIAQYDLASKRIDFMVRSLATFLVERHQGQSIKIYSRERAIPFPDDVLAGARLDSDRYMGERALIAEFTAAQLSSEVMPQVEGQNE